jgi:hypothetical protein
MINNNLALSRHSGHNTGIERQGKGKGNKEGSEAKEESFGNSRQKKRKTVKQLVVVVKDSSKGRRIPR